MKQLLKPYLFKLLNFYPPYFFTGIKVVSVSPDRTEIKVQMALRFYNQNAYGTHFGGSLYSMVDPFYALLLWYHLGDNYEIWDKSAKIDYLRPGRDTVFANFVLSQDEISRIKATLITEKDIEPTYKIIVSDKDNKEVAKIEKTLSIRSKIK